MAKAPKSTSLLFLLPFLHPSLQICTFHTCILTLWGSLHAGTGSMGELSQNSFKLVLMYASTPVGVDVCIHPIWYPIKTILVVFRTEKLAVAFVPTQILTKSSDTTFKTW